MDGWMDGVRDIKPEFLENNKKTPAQSSGNIPGVLLTHFFLPSMS